MNLDDILKKLCSRCDYLSSWLTNLRSAKEIAQSVQLLLEYTNWMIESLSKLPKCASEIEAPNLSDRIENKNMYIQNAFPMIPTFDTSLVEGATGLTASETATVYTIIVDIGSLDIPVVKDYSEEQLTKYHELENVYNRQEQVFNLIRGLHNENNIKRFNNALSDYTSYKIDPDNRTSVANDIRNLLYGIKSDLFEKARNWDKENMTWQKMAVRLAKGGSGSIEYEEIINQEDEFSKLIEILSKISKDRESIPLYNLNTIWIRTLDHIYVILNLINM